MTDAKAWKSARDLVSALTPEFQKIPGVISVHAQYTDPVMVVAVLVSSAGAKVAVRELEDDVFERQPDAPVDLFVYEVAPEDICAKQESLGMSYGLIWAQS